MNKTLAITAFVFVAVIMGMSAIAPAMAYQAEEDRHRFVGRPAVGDGCDIAEKKTEKDLPCENLAKKKPGHPRHPKG